VEVILEYYIEKVEVILGVYRRYIRERGSNIGGKKKLF